ncbi:unnamed protein product [Ectocarpus sp. 12 AP-2014]
MAISGAVRALVFALLVAFAVEAFVVPAPAALARNLGRPSNKQQLTPTPNTAATSSRSLTPARMSTYEQSSPEPSASGQMSSSSEMELQELIVDFTDDGRILLEVKGVKGNECRVITEDLIKALGDVITTENTEEYFQERVVNTQKDAVQLGWSYDASKPEW